jgi:hypothetical protein
MDLSRGLGDVYKRQQQRNSNFHPRITDQIARQT